MGFGHSIHVPGPATEPAGRTRYSGVRWQCSQCNRSLTNSVGVSQTPEHPLVCAAGGFHIFHYVLWAGVWLALLLLCQQTTPGMNSDSVIIPFLVSILNTPQHNVHDQWRIQNFRRGGGGGALVKVKYQSKYSTILGAKPEYTSKCLINLWRKKGAPPL